MAEQEPSCRDTETVPPVSPTLSVSVVICAHTEERWSALVAAVASVRQQLHPAHEIILVIDHNPGLLEQARSWFSDVTDVTVIANGQLQGLSGARNTGVANSSGDVVAFLDDDAVAAPDWLAHLIKGYAAANVWAVGGSIKPDWHTRRPGWFPEEFDWVVGCAYLGMPTVATEVRNLIGCNMSIRRGILEQVGGFHSGIGRFGADTSGCEETELFIRMRQQLPAATILYWPDAQVFHAVPSARSTWRYFRARCAGEGYSKALISQLVGSRDALSNERSYIMRTLPAGIIRGVIASLRSRNTDGLGRSGAILSGLLITSWAYLYRRAVMALARHSISLRATVESVLAESVSERGKPSQQEGSEAHGLEPGEHGSGWRHG